MFCLFCFSCRLWFHWVMAKWLTRYNFYGSLRKECRILTRYWVVVRKSFSYRRTCCATGVSMERVVSGVRLLVYADLHLPQPATLWRFPSDAVGITRAACCWYKIRRRMSMVPRSEVMYNVCSLLALHMRLICLTPLRFSGL